MEGLQRTCASARYTRLIVLPRFFFLRTQGPWHYLLLSARLVSSISTLAFSIKIFPPLVSSIATATATWIDAVIVAAWDDAFALPVKPQR